MDPRWPNPARPTGTGGRHRTDGCLAYPSGHRPLHCAGGRRELRLVRQRQPTDIAPPSQTLPAGASPPQLLQVEKGHGRIEWRGIEVKPVTPQEMGFPHVLQVARLDRIRVLNNGKQEVETVWLITSLSADQADAGRFCWNWPAEYWSIENGLHYRLDVSGAEDRCRVRHPVAATVLGILRSAVQGEHRAWARRQTNARDSTSQGSENE